LPLAIKVVCPPTDINSHIATLGPTQLFEASFECREAGLTFWSVRSPIHEDADATYLVRLLRA
jgi:hypothetical protein